MKGRHWALVLGLLIPTLQAPRADGPSPVVDPAARLPEGDSAQEYWDLVARLDSGHRFYARFLITNQGPGDHSAVATGDLVDPDGTAVPFQNGRRKGRWSLGADARSLRIGSSHIDLSGPAARVEIDNDKRGFEVVLNFEPDDSSAHVFDTDDAHLDLLHLASAVEGHVQHAEMPEPLAVTGRATLTHGWTSRPEGDGVMARIDVTTLSPDRAAFLAFWLSPGSRTRAWLGVRTADGRTQPTDVRQVRVDFPRGGEADYPLPTRLSVRGARQHATASLRGDPLRRNPLDALPMGIRMLYSFGAQPIRVWADATLRVEVESEGGTGSSSWETFGIATLNFQDAFPTPTPEF